MSKEINQSEFTGARYFLNIPAEVAHDTRIKRDKSILLFGEIYSMLNVTGAFYMSNKEIAKRLRCKTVKPVKEALNELESLGYIERKIITDKETGAVIGRKITSTWKPRMTDVSGERIQEEPHPSYDRNHTLVTTRTEGRVSEEPQIEHINRTINRTTNRNNKEEPAPPKGGTTPKDEPKDKKDKEEIPYTQIIDYLNKKTNQSLRATTKAYRRLIKARWNDGYKLDDFKTVIDNKSFEWQGTDFWKFMRPKTLFSASHFDDYLNENRRQSGNRADSGGYNVDKEAQEQFLSQIDDSDLPF